MRGGPISSTGSSIDSHTGMPWEVPSSNAASPGLNFFPTFAACSERTFLPRAIAFFAPSSRDTSAGAAITSFRRRIERRSALSERRYASTRIQITATATITRISTASGTPISTPPPS